MSYRSTNRIFRSSIGLKFVMALTGACLLLFVILHMLGNLQIFLGQDAFNSYAKFIKSLPEVLWLARIALLVLFLLHISCAFRLRSLNSAARPEEYRYRNTVQATAASLYMLETGLVILAFVFLHLAHFTLGFLQQANFHLVDAQGRHDVYSMVIKSFQIPTYSLTYIAAMLFLALHLSHAIYSMFQTLGVTNVSFMQSVKRSAVSIALLIALGYITIPVAVLSGFLSISSGASVGQ